MKGTLVTLSLLFLIWITVLDPPRSYMWAKAPLLSKAQDRQSPPEEGHRGTDGS